LISVVEFNDVNLLEDNFSVKRIHLGMKKENVLVPSLIPIELNLIFRISFIFAREKKKCRLSFSAPKKHLFQMEKQLVFQL